MTTRRWRPPVVYGAVALLVAGPLLRPGLVLAVDLNLSPTPRLPTMYFGLPEGTHEGALSRLPLDLLFVGLGRIGAVGLGEKLLLLAIVFLAGWGMHRAAPVRREAARTFAGLLYAVNPFVYDRLYTGQWFLLLGYALLPWGIAAFVRALNGDRRSFWAFVAVAVLAGVASPHMLLLLALLCSTVALAKVIATDRRGTLARRAGLAWLAVCLCSLYWLLPTPGLEDFWAHVGRDQLALYATVPDGRLGVAGAVAGLGGYWNNAQPAHAFQPAWPMLAAAIGALALWGLGTRRRDPVAWGIAAGGLLGALLALGARGPTGPLYLVLADHVAPARSFREPQKGVALVALAYAWLGAAGAEAMLTHARRHARAAAAVTTAAVVALPLALGYRQLGGLWGAMFTSSFPASWSQARTLLEGEAADSRTLVLPWHGYHALSFAGGRVVANTAPGFFSTPVLAARNVGEGLGAGDNSDPVNATVTRLLDDPGRTPDLGSCLAGLGVSRVLVAREADAARHRPLERRADLVVERRWRDLVLLRNTVPASLAMHATVLPTSSCPAAGTLRPLAAEASGATIRILTPAPRTGWIVLGAAYRPDWRLGTARPIPLSNGGVAFRAADVDGTVARLQATDTYRRNLNLGLAGLLVVLAAGLAGTAFRRPSAAARAVPPLPRAPRVSVVLPTYNEAENLEPMVRSLLQVFDRGGVSGEVLVVDDASPDGTGAIADRLAAEDGRVSVLHRTSKDGLGRAYAAGFTVALGRRTDLVVQMDCDFSHAPEDVLRLVAAAADADVVLGSRYTSGGDTADWGLGRRLISRGGCTYARMVLGVPVRDLTGGFKCFRAEALAAVDVTTVDAAGYGFQIATTYRALRRGFVVREVPIVFRDRVVGTSKMSGRIVLEAMLLVPQLRLRSHTAPTPSRQERPSGEPVET